MIPSCWKQWRTKPVDCRQYVVKQVASDGNLCELESDGPSMTDDPCTNLDQPGLQAGQRPVGHLFGQVQAVPSCAPRVGLA